MRQHCVDNIGGLPNPDSQVFRVSRAGLLRPPHATSNPCGRRSTCADGREVWIYAHPVDRGGITLALGDSTRGFPDSVVISPEDAAALGPDCSNWRRNLMSRLDDAARSGPWFHRPLGPQSPRLLLRRSFIRASRS